MPFFCNVSVLEKNEWQRKQKVSAFLTQKNGNQTRASPQLSQDPKLPPVKNAGDMRKEVTTLSGAKVAKTKPTKKKPKILNLYHLLASFSSSASFPLASPKRDRGRRMTKQKQHQRTHKKKEKIPGNRDEPKAAAAAQYTGFIYNCSCQPRWGRWWRSSDAEFPETTLGHEYH